MTITPPPDDARHSSWSLGETAALATKAARGAGMPWGLADETGFAVSWLHARGIAGLSALCRYLSWRHNDRLTQWPDHATGDRCYCPIALGTAYLDGALPDSLSIHNIREPALIFPFIAKRSGARPVQVNLDQLCLYISKNGVLSRYPDTALLLNQAACTISQAADPPVIPAPMQTQRVASCFYGCVTALQHFAGKTYAPATDESRLAGAGAGLNDND
jgi:hypothetical protein